MESKIRLKMIRMIVLLQRYEVLTGLMEFGIYSLRVPNFGNKKWIQNLLLSTGRCTKQNMRIVLFWGGSKPLTKPKIRQYKFFEYVVAQKIVYYKIVTNDL